MEKGVRNFLIIVGLVLAFIFFKWNFTIGSQAITGSEIISRTGPANADVSSTFTITYAVSSASGSWGASIEDSIVSGGCKFPNGGTGYKGVMMSDDGNSKSITITAPSTAATCVFSGNYKFGELGIVNLNSYSVNIRSCTPLCTRPSNQCTEAATVSNGCGGMCTGSWTVSRLTTADADCNNIISRLELGTAITGWVADTYSREDLGRAISSWVANG